MEKHPKIQVLLVKRTFLGQIPPCNQSFVYFCTRSNIALATYAPALYKTSKCERIPIRRTMFKPTKHFLKKIEGLFESAGYTVRYEKGNFQSGYCMVEQRKVAVINKFFDTESRVNTLIDILKTVALDEAAMDEKNRKLLQDIRSNTLLTENEEELSN
jgi:hypothetical protein